MNTIRSDSGTGNGLSKTEFTMVKIAKFAPRHTASVRIAVVEKPRSFHNAFIEIVASRSMPSIFIFPLLPSVRMLLCRLFIQFPIRVPLRKVRVCSPENFEMLPQVAETQIGVVHVAEPR